MLRNIVEMTKQKTKRTTRYTKVQMKRLPILLILLVSAFFLHSCKKENKNIWDVKIETPAEKIPVTDISKDFFAPEVTLEQFRAKYPWFQGSVKDEDFIKRRNSAEEAKLYREAATKVDLNLLGTDLGALFARVKHHFPNFKNPKVYTFSSSTQMYEEPVIYDPQQGFLFIDISGFMGEKSQYYKGIEEYFKVSMNPENIIPRTSEAIAFTIVPYSKDSQKFLDQMVYNGKIMTLQDAFLPHLPDHLKMNATAKQYEWSKASEVSIWDYFIENDYLFSPDPRLTERFINPGPFSKFYTDVDKQSSPQVGVFTGWQICRKFYEKNPETPLLDFLAMSATDIFNKSEYKPKK